MEEEREKMRQEIRDKVNEGREGRRGGAGVRRPGQGRAGEESIFTLSMTHSVC